jgi:hypothetical protein
MREGMPGGYKTGHPRRAFQFNELIQYASELYETSFSSTLARNTLYTQTLYAMTMGTKITATTVMMVRVYWLEDELNIVRLYEGSMLDGMRLGNSPVTPVKVTKRMVTHEAAKALNIESFDVKYFMAINAATAMTGISKRPGHLK